jgi:hypothetical protein
VAKPFNPRALVWVLIALAVGFAVGVVYRRHHDPTVEERIEDAAHELQKGIRGATDKLTR